MIAITWRNMHTMNPTKGDPMKTRSILVKIPEKDYQNVVKVSESQHLKPTTYARVTLLDRVNECIHAMRKVSR